MLAALPRVCSAGVWMPLLGSNQAARIQSPLPYQLGEGALACCLNELV